MSKSPALSIGVSLIFVMQLLNGALFLKANFLSCALLSGAVTIAFLIYTRNTIVVLFHF